MKISSALSPREKLVIGLSSTAVVVGLCLTRGIPAYRAWKDAMGEEEFGAMASISRLRSDVARADANRDSMRIWQARLDAPTTRVVSSLDALQALGTQLLVRVADSAGVRLESSRVDEYPASEKRACAEADCARWISLHATIAGRTEGTLAFIASLLARREQFVMTEVAIDSRNAGAQAVQSPLLHSEFTVRVIGRIAASGLTSRDDARR